MAHAASDGKQSSRWQPSRWSGHGLKIEGLVFAIVGVVSTLVVEVLAELHSITLATRDVKFRGCASFVLVGFVTLFIGWRKSRRTGS